MIKPTVGRIVLFHRAGSSPDAPPLPAIICMVSGTNDNRINLATFNRYGMPFPAIGVRLIQEGEEPPPAGAWAEWMPYQKAVAAGTQAPTLHADQR